MVYDIALLTLPLGTQLHDLLEIHHLVNVEFPSERNLHF